jgi:PAS domain S-box-containing protein
MTDVSNKSILIIDDDEIITEYVKEVLDARNIKVRAAFDGQSGLHMYQQQRPDLMLVDLRLPDISGFDIISKIRKKDTLTPIIVISGTGTIEDAIEAIRRGAWDYMVKPFQSKNIVYHTIDNAFERAQLIEENRLYQENLELKVADRTKELTEINERLQQSETRYRSVVEDQTETIIRYIKDGSITFVNDSFCRFFGTQREYILKESFYPYIHKEDLAEVKDKIKSLSHKNPVAVDERRVYLPNGNIGWQQCTDRIIENDSDEELEYQSVGVDITERKRSEQALKEALNEVEFYKNQLQDENVYLQEEIKTEHNFDEIIGKSSKMRTVFKNIEIVAPNDTTVLIIGETGTGKELIARAVHNLSSRRNKPLVKVNCAALPSSLIESELFGHVKGAFTGALSDRRGRFELADKGTIFLDEISEIPMELQGKLLRVLQEGEFERVGGEETIAVNVRVIAATNRDLSKAIKNKTFREDLYYRLNVIPISIPPLRERKEDIEELATYFAIKYGRKMGKKFTRISRDTLEYLFSLQWPGNIRELQNLIERSVILGKEPVLYIENHLAAEKETDPQNNENDLSLEAIERRHITRILTQTNWVVEGDLGAAKMLNLHPNTLRSRMKKLQIIKPRS